MEWFRIKTSNRSFDVSNGYAVLTENFSVYWSPRIWKRENWKKGEHRTSKDEQMKEPCCFQNGDKNREKCSCKICARSGQLFCMQTVPLDQHVWKYFLKTRKTPITLNLGFPFESGSIQSIGLSISKLLTEQPFKPFISWWRGRKYLKYLLDYHIFIKFPRRKMYKVNPPFCAHSGPFWNMFLPKNEKIIYMSVL